MTRLDYDFGSGVIAFSTERDAERPDDPYSGFNACHYTGDDPARVASCRERLVCMLSGVRDLVIPRQTHSLNVAVIDSIPAGQLEDVDALVTALPGVAIAVNTADCVPVLMADAYAGVIAAVHSGWRGSVGHIVLRALESMVALGADSRRVKVVMGPSICSKCFEVGPEVAEEFEKAFPGLNGIIIRHSHIARPYIDLRAAIRHDLTAAGLTVSHIDTTTAPCSRCNPTSWWSARRQGINSGRTLSVIMRK